MMDKMCVGKIHALFYSKEGISERIPLLSIDLDEKGILGDKFYNKNIQRSVLLTSTDSYLLAQKEGISMNGGLLGENILMDYNPYHLSPGSKLFIGSTILEITQYCTMCEHLNAIDPILPILLSQDRGIFSKVIQPGKIRKGDLIFIDQTLGVSHRE